MNRGFLLFLTLPTRMSVRKLSKIKTWKAIGHRITLYSRKKIQFQGLEKGNEWKLSKEAVFDRLYIINIDKNGQLITS